MQPSEFWALSTTEFWWEADRHLASQKKVNKKQTAQFSEAAWKRAREEHRKKMNE